MTEKTEETKAWADADAAYKLKMSPEGYVEGVSPQAVASLTTRVTTAEGTITAMGGHLGILASSLRVSGPPVIEAVVIDPRVLRDGLPATQTVESAGFDLRAYPYLTYDGVDQPMESIWLEPGEQAMVSTGLRVWINKPGYAGFMFARSGTGSKGLVLGNGTGVIDSDYQGPLKMCLWNRSDESININAGDRVAQLVIMPVLTGYEFKVVEDFDGTTARGQNGFGSTGVK